MPEQKVLNVDLADVWAERNRKSFLRTIAWGDEVTVLRTTPQYVEIEVTRFEEKPDGSVLPVVSTGYVEPNNSSGLKTADLFLKVTENRVLKVNFVDVQQGDGAVIESPSGEVILVDGGDNQMFARYLAGRYRGTSAESPKEIGCILVTHGDADHFEGLPKIYESETHSQPRKRLFIRPRRYFHNGIVKRPSKVDGRSLPDVELLGPTQKVGDDTILTGLEDNLLDVADKDMNAPFKAWKKALKAYNERSAIEFRRLEFGEDDAFDFFNDEAEGLRIEVLGPLMFEKSGVRGLKFLGEPPKGPRGQDEVTSVEGEGFKGLSASHTINGHSIVFRLVYGGFSYLFCGDLNDEASRFLAREHNAGSLSLLAEVFKVPHHGSADFSGAFLQAVAPLVSVVSSGDESSRKEYIHPRATLMGALGRFSRSSEPLIFVTELVAFFQLEGWARKQDKKGDATGAPFFGFSRAAYGLVKTRTDGQRLLVYTDSGNLQMKEAYAFQLDDHGAPQPASVARA